MTQQDARVIATRYIDAWNETDPTKRQALIASLWAESASYIDPLMQASGQSGINELIAGVQGRFPEFRFALRGPVDGYADRLRFSWGLGPESGSPVVEGTDFATLAEDGRLHAVIGFIDRMPAPQS